MPERTACAAYPTQLTSYENPFAKDYGEILFQWFVQKYKRNPIAVVGSQGDRP